MLRVRGGKVTIDTADVVKAGIVCSNLAIHVMDAVDHADEVIDRSKRAAFAAACAYDSHWE